jgi:hypothetical protein
MCSFYVCAVGPFISVPGFQVFDRKISKWLDASSLMGCCAHDDTPEPHAVDLLLLCNEHLEDLSQQGVLGLELELGRKLAFQACLHRVSWVPQPRTSMMYERRLLVSDENSD